MPTEHDNNLAKAVVEEGLVGEEEVKVCLAEMERAESIGAVIALETVLVKKGLLTQEQIDVLLQSLRRKNVPSKLGGFEIIEPIGRGGMHAVYKAKQVAMDRTVALKILSSEFTKEKRHVERLFQEARAAAQLNHVNIVQAIDAGESSGYYYFASEYVEGESVAERLQRDGTIGESDTLAIAEQVCNALIHIHTAAGKIHGDIKPGNIMVTSQGVAKLVDLGLANSIQGAQGTIMCSPHYSAPERIRQNPDIDFRSDIYSLGATIFHMITGKPPFTGPNAKAILSKHLTEPAPELATAGTPPSRGLRALVQKILEKDPRDRHQSLGELLEDIKKVRNPRVIRTHEERIARPPKPRGTHKLLVVAVVLLFIAAAAGYVVYDNSKTKKDEIVEQSGEDTGERPSTAAAADALASAEAFAKTNPDELQEIASRFRQVASNHAGTEQATRAAQRAEHFTRLHEQRAQTAQTAQTLERVKQEAAALAEQQRYGDAIMALRGFPEDLKTAAIKTDLLDEETRLKERAERHVRELVARAEELARRNEYLAAAELLETAKKFGFSDINETVDERTAAYRTAAAELAGKDAAERFAHSYDGALGAAMLLAREHRFDEAVAALDEFAAQHRDVDLNERFDGEFAAMRDEIESAAATWAKIIQALQAKTGHEVSLRVAGILLNGNLQKIDGSTLTIVMRGTPITRKLGEINGDDALALAGLDGSTENTIKRMQFYLAASDMENALKEARSLGDGELFELWAERIARCKKLLADHEIELQLRERLNRARQALDAGRAAQAYRLLAPLRRDMPPSPALRDEIRDLFAQTEAALAVMWKIEHRPGQLLALLDTLRETFQWQDENACPETVPCPDCDCKGFTTGIEQCGQCLGEGTITCPMCRGRGTLRLRMICPSCGGTGRIVCEICGGRGVVERRYTCETCQGKREIVCPICRGTGYKRPMPERYKSALHDMQVHNIGREEVEKLFAE